MQEILLDEAIKNKDKNETQETGKFNKKNRFQNKNFNKNKINKLASIDFNCDLAQSFGVYQNENEFEMLDYVSSVNISTGFHAGDPLTIKKALLAAKEKNVVIGAHIGFNDIQGFGNRAMSLSEEETEALVIYQVSAMMSFAKAFGLEIEHVRPHGAMYKMASEDLSFALAIAKGIKKCSNWLVYYGAAGEIIAQVGEKIKLPIAHEIKLNKSYNIDGSVNNTAREITNVNFAAKRLQTLLRSSQIDNIKGGSTQVEANTIHFSSSSASSIELLKRANEIITPIPVNFNKVKSSGWV